ncbi:MAG: class I SAM-dependent methyltransferase [Hyphomicrobiaceae bacterium]
MQTGSENPVLAHNHQSARMWSAGGAGYDQVSFAISDALAHAAQRLAPGRDARVLDCATGTGWTARNLARMGAQVTAIDIAGELLDAARTLSRGIEPAIDYRLADVEALPFADGTFDGVISTFGVMFAGDHRQAASELARVCRRGGRLVLATWRPGGAVAEFFGVIAAHTKEPPPEPSPMLWGDPDYLQGLIGSAFDLTFESGVNHAYHASPAAIWSWYLNGFGPMRMIHQSLDADGQTALRRDVDAYHEHYRVPAGLCVTRDYLVTIGTRR